MEENKEKVENKEESVKEAEVVTRKKSKFICTCKFYMFISWIISMWITIRNSSSDNRWLCIKFI